jgi:Na+/phosphate symporter
MILAQIESIAPDWLRNMAIFITCLAATAYYIKGLMGGKQKREVSFDDPKASKKEFDQFTAITNANFVQVRDEMTKDRRDNQVHASERQKTIFAAIEKTRIEMTEKHEELRSEIQRNFQDTERALGRIEGKIEGKL